MATESFHEMMRIDTPEKIKKLVEAFEAAEKRGRIKYTDEIFEEIEKGERIIRGQSP